MITGYVKGYNSYKEFYSPDYATHIPEHENEDKRNTLYWNPYLFTSPEDNKIMIQFYNNDFSRSYQILLTGVSNDGKFIELKKTVNRP